eukprot:COSAG01_NODE_9292_length_2492_cov_3.570832_3_plen_91_part_00
MRHLLTNMSYKLQGLQAALQMPDSSQLTAHSSQGWPLDHVERVRRVPEGLPDCAPPRQAAAVVTHQRTQGLLSVEPQPCVESADRSEPGV